MRKIFLIAINIVFSIIIFVPIAFFAYITYQLHSLKEDTYDNLLENYQADQIQKVDTQLTKASYRYAAIVTFKDEPDYVYEYIRIEGKIRQTSPSPFEDDAQKYKHLEAHQE